MASPDVRAARFHELLRGIDAELAAVLDGSEIDIVYAIYSMRVKLEEAHTIAAEVSLEALEDVMGR